MSVVETFIARWQGVTASELATAQSFVIDLCRLLGVEAPHPTPEQDYMFERPITFRPGSIRLRSIRSASRRASPVKSPRIWPRSAILEHLVALNAERVAEEEQGHIRWLRPAFQNPQGVTQAGMEVSRPTICDSHEEVGIPPSPPAPKGKTPWPSTLPELLATLATLGHAWRLEDGRSMGQGI